MKMKYLLDLFLHPKKVELKLVDLNDNAIDMRWSSRLAALILYFLHLFEKPLKRFARVQIITYERIWEYPLVFKNIKTTKGCRILDTGCCGSRLPLHLASLGYDTYAIDIGTYSFSHPNLTVLRESITNLSFPDNFFDVVISVSTVEHIGLGRYGETTFENGDSKAITELTRVCKLRKQIMITVPFGRRFAGRGYRVYDWEQIQSLIKGLDLVQAICFYRKDATTWIPSSKKEVEDIDSSKEPLNGGIFLHLRKHNPSSNL